MDQVLLRQAKDDDIPTLVTLVHDAFEEYRGRLDPPSGAHADTTTTIGQRLHKGGAALALVNQQFAGCVFYEPRNDFIYLGRLAVLPAYRRFSVGRELVSWVEKQARTLGFTRVHLAVRVALSGNRAFFERLGYRMLDYGTHAGYAQPTFVNMEKEISM
jgi:GNAT superfamily N-acetyltransferase